MKKYMVYYDQRLEVEVQATCEEEAKNKATEIINDEVSVEGNKVNNDGLEFADIEELEEEYRGITNV